MNENLDIRSQDHLRRSQIEIMHERNAFETVWDGHKGAEKW